MSRRVASLIPWVLIVMSFGWFAAVDAAGQAAPPSGVAVRVEPEGIGIGGGAGQPGAVRPGTWTPLRVRIDNNTSRIIPVRCQWVFPDIDGDEAQAERTFSLTPNRKDQTLWLYSVPPINTAGALRSEVRIIEYDPDDPGAAGTLLASQPVIVPYLVEPDEQVIAATTSQGILLKPFTNDAIYAQHEKLRREIITRPSDLPDRWYGLSVLQTLVWTADADEDPTSPAISRETREALLEWVRRGGHIVISLPSIGDPWSNAEGLSELVDGVKTRRLLDQPVPRALSIRVNSDTLELNAIEPTPKMSVLLRAGSNTPADPAIVVAYPYGLGRVTVVGMDLTHRSLASIAQPRENSFWSRVLNWNAEVLTDDFIKGEANEGRIASPDNPVSLDRAFIPHRIAMQGTASGPLLLSLLIFVVYFLLAGPVGYAVLRARDQARHSWVAFVIIIGVTTAVTWGAALMLRPSREKIAHFSVIDADAESGAMHAHSWVSVFSPSHGSQSIAIETPKGAENRNVISSPGLSRTQEAGSFLDPQRYAFSASAPHRLNVPFRATAKQLELDYAASPGQFPLAEQWVMPQGRLTMDENGTWPTGKLSHKLPGTLRFVKVLYCKGHGGDVWVWSMPDWKPGDVVDIKFAPPGLQPLIRPSGEDDKREWRGLMQDAASASQGFTDTINSPKEDQIARLATALTFYNALPTPKYRLPDVHHFGSTIGYRRSIGRPMDLSHHLALRRVIIIGFILNSPLPVPLTLGGDPPAASDESWTMVRWMAPIEGAAGNEENLESRKAGNEE